MNDNDRQSDDDSQVLFLDFQFRPEGACILITRSPFPLTLPNCVAVAFNVSAFEVQGGVDARVDLLYSLENEFGDWSEHRRALVAPVMNAGANTSEESFIFTVTNLKSSAELHRATDLFIKAAATLIRLNRQGPLRSQEEN
jgi:hypothetical protein